MKKNSLVIFLCLTLLVSLVLAIPNIPYAFNGEACESGGLTGCKNTPLDGLEITATVGGAGFGVVGRIGEDNVLLDNDGFEGVSLDSQGTTGEVIFYIGGVEAESNYEIVISGGEVNRTFDEVLLKINELPEEYAFCGDGNLSVGEQCDGTQFGFATCENVMSLYYGRSGYSGQLGCSSSCTFDVANCTAPVQQTSTSSGGSSGGGSSGGGGGSSGGGGGSSTRNVVTLSTNSSGSSNSTVNETNTTALGSEVVSEVEEETNEGFFKATGLAISDFSKTRTGKGVLAIIIAVVLIGLFMLTSSKSKKTKNGKTAKKVSGKKPSKNIKVVKASELRKRKK